MEDNILKQAKNDIFKAVESIVEFDLKRGVTPEALRKYYKKPKNILTFIGRLRNKGSNLFSHEHEYEVTVRDILYGILDDRITHNKDEKEKKKKFIKEWYEFNENYFATSKSISSIKKKELKDELKVMLEFASNMNGKLSSVIKSRIVRYFNNPSAKLWDDICGYIFSIYQGQITLWQAVLNNDPNIKQARFFSNPAEKWYKIPDPETIVESMKPIIRNNIIQEIIKMGGEKEWHKLNDDNINNLIELHNKLMTQKRFDL